MFCTQKMLLEWSKVLPFLKFDIKNLPTTYWTTLSLICGTETLSKLNSCKTKWFRNDKWKNPTRGISENIDLALVIVLQYDG